VLAAVAAGERRGSQAADDQDVVELADLVSHALSTARVSKWRNDSLPWIATYGETRIAD
jgi:hypothetical protein